MLDAFADELYDGADEGLDAFGADGFEDEGFEDGFEDGFEEDGFEESAFEANAFEDGFEDGFEDDGLAFDAFADDGFEAEDRFQLDEGYDDFDLSDGAVDELDSWSDGFDEGLDAADGDGMLNAFVLDSLEEDDSEAFFRRIGRGLSRIARGVGGAIRRAAPMLRNIAGRALPMLGRIVSHLGPIGRLAGGGLSALGALSRGEGWRGALRAGLGTVLPGPLGSLAGRLIPGGQGFEEDASLDALADLADAGEADAAVAAPLGAGLAARVVARAGVLRGRIARLPAHRALYARVRRAEQAMLRALTALPGSLGRRLRLLRFIARAAAAVLRRRPARAAVVRLPAVVRAVTRRVAGVAAARPTVAARTPVQAARRVAARRRVVARARATGVLARARAAGVRRAQVARAVRARPVAARVAPRRRLNP